MSTMTVWLSRDRDPSGELSLRVDVWLSRPRSLPLGVDGVGTLWLCDEELVASAQGDVPARWAVWSLAQCVKFCGTYPETERELIRFG